jgi:hypothetical protein
MFGSNLFNVVQVSPDHLRIQGPGSFLGGYWLIGFMLAVFLIVTWRIGITLRKEDAKARVLYPELTIPDITPTVRKAHLIGVISAIGLPLVWMFLSYSSGSIDLDRSTHTATMTAKMTAFLPAQKGSMALSQIAGAVLDYKPNARRIRLTTLSGGDDLAYPLWSDRKGQQEAVNAINRFLAERAVP